VGTKPGKFKPVISLILKGNMRSVTDKMDKLGALKRMQ